MRVLSQLSTESKATSPCRRTTLGTLGVACILAAATAGLALFSPVHALESPVTIAAPAQDIPASGQHTETAVLAGGCFWGIQGVYQHVRGVQRVVSGYAGGT